MNAQAVGRVFDALMRLEKASQAAREAQRLSAELRRVGTVCGDCRLWMTRACPKEVNVNGWNRGPSYASARCASFEEAQEAARRHERLAGEFVALEARGRG